MTKVFFKMVLVVVVLAFAGCGDQAQKDAASFKEGMDAFSKGDHAVALEKFKPLAERGNVEAQYGLGLVYSRGQGVAKDDKEAGAWFSKAAEQGHVEAQQNLALSYAKGLGVERNWVQADKWFIIASASGKETAANNRKVIEVHMPPEQIAEADALAQEWLAKHEK